MPRVFLHYLPTQNIYTCRQCGCHLSSLSQVISKTFTGKTGTAYLFNKVINCHICQIPRRCPLTSGMHQIADIYCLNCKQESQSAGDYHMAEGKRKLQPIGWTYFNADQPIERYKLGKFILQLAYLKKYRWIGSSTVPDTDNTRNNLNLLLTQHMQPNQEIRRIRRRVAIQEDSDLSDGPEIDTNPIFNLLRRTNNFMQNIPDLELQFPMIQPQQPPQLPHLRRQQLSPLPSPRRRIDRFRILPMEDVLVQRNTAINQQIRQQLRIQNNINDVHGNLRETLNLLSDHSSNSNSSNSSSSNSSNSSSNNDVSGQGDRNQSQQESSSVQSHQSSNRNVQIQPQVSNQLQVQLFNLIEELGPNNFSEQINRLEGEQEEEESSQNLQESQSQHQNESNLQMEESAYNNESMEESADHNDSPLV